MTLLLFVCSLQEINIWWVWLFYIVNDCRPISCWSTRVIPSLTDCERTVNLFHSVAPLMEPVASEDTAEWYAYMHTGGGFHPSPTPCCGLSEHEWPRWGSLALQSPAANYRPYPIELLAQRDLALLCQIQARLEPDLSQRWLPWRFVHCIRFVLCWDSHDQGLEQW